MNYKPKTVVEQASHQAQGKKKQQASQEVTWVRYEVNTKVLEKARLQIKLTQLQRRSH